MLWLVIIVVAGLLTINSLSFYWYRQRRQHLKEHERELARWLATERRLDDVEALLTPGSTVRREWGKEMLERNG